jgi:hypothetical protein
MIFVSRVYFGGVIEPTAFSKSRAPVPVSLQIAANEIQNTPPIYELKLKTLCTEIKF